MARQVLRWILTGGIGSGKSTVAGLLRTRGIRVIDADRIGHAVLEPDGDAFESVARRWPEVVVDGRVDRRALAEIVFADPAQLSELEAIVHPPVRRRLRGMVDEAGGEDLVVEVSVPKRLVDDGFHVVVVDAPDEVRARRLRERGLSEMEIERRMGVQPSRDQWVEMADLVITNDSTVDRLEDELIRTLEQALLPRRPPRRQRYRELPR